MALQVIKVECIREYSPPNVRVTVLADTGLEYSFDIPSSIYPDVGAPLGWPTSPCGVDN